METEGKTPLKALEEKLGKAEGNDAKLMEIIAFMEETLSQEKTPRFKEFWDARTRCLEIMKEEIAPPVRALAWEKFTELTQQARKLKELFEEESNFQHEQFEMAIAALEEELNKIATGEFRVELPKFSHVPQALKSHLHQFEVFEKELRTFGAFSERIHSFRKELTKTGMRVKKKNALFERLSSAGDKVFPVRKELIEKESTLFLSEVEALVGSIGKAKGSLAPFRDDIKAFQAFAKELTLNAPTFKKCREMLSGAWDKVKELDQAHRAEVEMKIQESREQAAHFIERVDALMAQFNEKKISLAEIVEKEREIMGQMRHKGLGKPEQKLVRDALDKLHELANQQKMEAEGKMRAQEKDVQQKREALRQNFLERIERGEDPQVLDGELEKADLAKKEKDELYYHLHKLKDRHLDEKQDVAKTKEELHHLLGLRTERKREIKDELNRLRKHLGVSSLDLTEQLFTQEKVQELKGRLEAMEERSQALEKRLGEG